MDPSCHQCVSPRSPAKSSVDTVSCLIRNIEQLKNKDKLISQLEKDLGHRWAAAHIAALERTHGEGAPEGAEAYPMMGAPSCPPGALPIDDGSAATDSFSWTPTSAPTPWSVEDERSAGEPGQVKLDLPKKLKDKNKELVEKCRAYLHRSRELTVQNRAYKDGSDRALQENKKLQELLEHSKLRLLQVSRQVAELKAERSNMAGQAEREEAMRREGIEDKKAIAALTQACSEKDRRIELIQHRKKRRRVMGSAEKTMGVRETFYGYDEDTNSVASEASSSLSQSTISDEDFWDVLSREDTERNYQRLAMEQLQLQKAHALLQREVGSLQDPQREALSHSHVQHDLFDAQCRIEQLEKLVNEIGEGEVITLLKEREAILAENKDFYEKIQDLEAENHRLLKDLMTFQDKVEELEFRLIEFENMEEEESTTGSSPCLSSPAHSPDPGQEPHPPGESEGGVSTQRGVSSSGGVSPGEMEAVVREVAQLLKGRGKEADIVLRKLNKYRDIEENAASMEDMSRELQKQLVALQTENDTLIDKLAKGRGSKGDQERQDNLELKVEIARLLKSEAKFVAEKDSLNDLIGILKAKNSHLKHQLDLVTSGQLGVKVHEVTSSDSASESPSASPSQSPKRRKSKSRGGDETNSSPKKRRNNESVNSAKPMKSISGDENAEPTQNNESGESEKMKAAKRKIKELEAELKEIRDENVVLVKQLQKNLIQKSSEAETEADQPMMVDRLRDLEAELDLSRRENEALARQLNRRRDEEHNSIRMDGYDSPRTSELEEYCEDLQERLRAAEASERHLKEKLRLVEGIIHDSESSEMAVREENDKLVVRESEAKAHLSDLQKTVMELKDIISDKDCMEQALRMKVDFLQKAEEASVRRITELEAVERELREDLATQGGGDGGQRVQHKVLELRHQLTFLETDNKALNARVSELEENEEILRENWRRVAEEDYDKSQCLDQKVKMLEDMNRELKFKLTDKQDEYYVINSNMGGADRSLAAELAGSKTSLAQPYSSSDSESDTETAQIEQRNIREKVKKLERTLSEVKDQKNTAIESLREKVEGLKDDEIKLSETISEMEMTERELRAKLELYESSEVTVEKMLKYQSKIQELRTSQESLLDQLDAMENQGMTMQERNEEVERTLRGHIVTLEVEMKGAKTKEIKSAARIRELEKLEKELTEKTSAQAEKENGLYVRISSLMDDLKAARLEGEGLKEQGLDKDEKIRKSKLLEVKLLEIEMEFGKKKSALSSQLRHKEEELRQKEVAHEEKVKIIKEELTEKVKVVKEELTVKESAQADKIAAFAAREKSLNLSMSSMEGEKENVASERDELIGKVEELTAEVEKLRGGEEDVREIMEEMENLRSEEAGYENTIKELSEEVDGLLLTVDGLKNDMVQSEMKIKELIESNEALKGSKIRSENQMSELSEEVEALRSSEKEVEELKQQLDIYKAVGQEGEEKLEQMEEDVSKEKSRAEKAESRVKDLEKELETGKDNVIELETTMVNLKEDIAEKMKNIESNIEKDEEIEHEKKSMTEELNVKKHRVEELERHVEQLNTHISELQTECDQIKSEALSVEKDMRDRLEKIDNSMGEKEKALKELQDVHEQDLEAERQDSKQKVNQAMQECAQFKQQFEQAQQECVQYEQRLEQTQKEHGENQGQLLQVEESFNAKLLEFQTLLQEKNVALNSKEEDISRLACDATRISQMLEERSSELENLKVQYETDMTAMRQEQESLERELRNKVMFLNTQLMQQVEEKEQQENSLQEKGDIEATLASEVERLKLEIQKHQLDLQDRLSSLEKKDKENDKLSREVTSLKQEFDMTRKDWSKMENSLEHKIEDRDQTINRVNDDYKNLQTQFSELEDKFCQRNISLEEMKSNFDNVQLKLSEKEQIVEETCQRELIVQEQMQKNEKVLLETGKAKQDREADLKESVVILQQTKSELEDKNTKYEQTVFVITDLEKKVSHLEMNISHLESELSDKENKIKHQSTQLQEKTSELETLCEKLAEAETNLDSTQSKTQSEVELKQQDLAHAQEELCKVLEEVHQKEEALQSKEQDCQVKDEALQAIAQDCQQKDEALQAIEHDCQQKDEALQAKERRCSELLEERQELVLKLEQHHQEHQAAQEKITVVQTELKDAENRYRELEAQVASLELRLEERWASAQGEEKVLMERESELYELKAKLDRAELKLSETRDDCKKLEEELSDVKGNCEASVEEAESKLKVSNAEHESKISGLSQKLEQAEHKLEVSIVETEQLESKIASVEKTLQEESSLETSLRDKQLECGYLNSEIENLQNLLDDKQFECEGVYVKLKDSEVTSKQMRQALQDQESELAETQEQLIEKDIQIKKSETECKNSNESSQDLQEECANLKCELKSVEEEKKDIILKLTSFKESDFKKDEEFKALQAQLELFQTELNTITEEAKSKEESLLSSIQSLEDENKVLRTNIQNMEITMTGNNLEVVVANEKLNEKLKQSEQELRDKSNRCEDLEDKLDDISLDRDAAVSKVKHLQNAKDQVDEENSSLHEELEEASKEFENLNIELQRLRSEKEEAELKLQSKKEEAEAKLRSEKEEAESQKSDLEEQLTQENSTSRRLQSRVDSLMVDNESLTQEVIDLNTENDALREKVKNAIKSDTKSDSVNLTTVNRTPVVESEVEVSNCCTISADRKLATDDKTAVVESEVQVAVVKTVSAAPKILNDSNDNVSVDDGKLSMQELLKEIEFFQDKDATMQADLNDLESSLQVIRDKEAKLISRNEELVSKEKELLEQITDIEQTVIVPLESENEELKDEVAVLKQERDEALAAAGLDEDDNDASSLRKSLEDSLLVKEEFEKKNAILSQDLHVIERERDNLTDRVTELKSEKEELEEKLECLEVEIDRLENLEKDKTVVEEAENSLMDRVLDLEEKELQLKEQLKKAKVSESSLKEQLDYIKQKTEVLQDAEGKYMDRIMELEEGQHRLQSEIQRLKAAASQEHPEQQLSRSRSSSKEDADQTESLVPASEPLMQVDELTLVNQPIVQSDESPLVMTESIIHAEFVPQEMQMTESIIHAEFASQNNTSLSHNENPLSQSDTSLSHSNGATSLLLSKSNASVDTSDLENSSEGSNMSSEASHQVSFLETENKKLLSDLDESQTNLNSLQEKLVLLQDSEARLMEKLIEAEENSDNTSSNKNNSVASSLNSTSDLLPRIDALIEENEFLAGNIETYKRLFKEEKSKVNDMQDKIQEDSFQLEEAQSMAGDIQSEYEEQLGAKAKEMQGLMDHLAEVEGALRGREEERDELLTRVTQLEASSVAHNEAVMTTEAVKVAKLEEIIADLENRVQELQTSVDNLTSQNERLMASVDALTNQKEQLGSQLADQTNQNEYLQDSINHLTKHSKELQSSISQYSNENDQLQSTLDSHHQMEDDWRSQERIKMRELEGQVAALTQRKDELRMQCREQEQRLQAELDSANQRELSATKALEMLEAELSQMRRSVTRQEGRSLEGRSMDSADSGVSGDEPRNRLEPPTDPAHQAPTAHQVYASKATVVLARPTSAADTVTRRSPAAHDTPRPHSAAADSLLARASPVNHGRATPPMPVAPPRLKKGKSRTSSFDSSSGASQQGEPSLNHQFIDLNGKEAYLKKRFEELEAQRLSGESARHSGLTEAGDYNKNVWGLRSSSRFDELEEDRLNRSQEALNRSWSSNTSLSMLDKPEDILQQRIKELERLDSHNKNQFAELERDREVLHEIARKDKSIIHELNVRLRELQLSERSLKEQVHSLESSESSLYSRCEGLEATRSKLEDRCHELEIHERRLRELVRKFKLDEEQWLSKSGGMETAVMELSGREQQLKRALQDMELEQGGSMERAEYLEGRVRELEGLEVTLLQRVRNYENNEVTLQNRLVHLENSEAASQSKASELDVINADLAQRLQRAIEENAVISQHTTQLHGQVQDLDRRLMTSRDSELAYKQHVESLQKNESSLQKKVREYELREIDSQARIRELEQTNEIMSDKLATLQRSENKLKYRVHELEGIGGQIPGELTPSQRQKMPQKLEDCQKRVLVLQSQVENLQLKLRQALTHENTDSQSSESQMVSVTKEEHKKLQTKAALLVETEYQLEQVEDLNEGLNQTVLTLRQGKGASGHEVEVEVLKRRVASYKTLMEKLKSDLPAGQATSLGDPHHDSVSDGDAHVPERVLQPVGGVHSGKTGAPFKGRSSVPGDERQPEALVQSSAAKPLSSKPADRVGGTKSGPPSNQEEPHWQAIEARKLPAGRSSRGGAPPAAGVTRVSHGAGARVGGPELPVEEEEVILGINLLSESELSSYHRTTQNDTDSSVGGVPVPPPRRGRGKQPNGTNNNHDVSSESEGSDGQLANELSARTAAAANDTNNVKHFGLHNNKSLPSVAQEQLTQQWTLQQQQLQQQQQQQHHHAPLESFGDDSFYLPSSAPEGESTMEEDSEAPPLPAMGPPGGEPHPLASTSRDTLDDFSMSFGQTSTKRNSLENSTSGISIRDRISMIEKSLSEKGGHSSEDDQVFYLKNKHSDAVRQAEGLDRDNKHIKDDINKLERELEEKRRYINILELWLSSSEDLLKNKDKQTDREIVEDLELDLNRLRKDLSQAGYRGDDAEMDAAALMTELERKDREITSKKSELEGTKLELQRVRSERDGIEAMRSTALDSLRGLEQELVGLEASDAQLREARVKLVEITKQYDEMENYKNQAVTMMQPLQTQVERLTRKCKDKDALLRRLGAELRRVCHRPSSALDDLAKLEALTNGEGTSPRAHSVDDLNLDLAWSDSESSPSPRPRSAEAARRGTHAHPRWGSHGVGGEAGGQRSDQYVPQGGQYVAVNDHDPSLYSTSGRPGMELAVREGDHVLITGPVDGSGYHEAVISGRSGLVPANILYPLRLNGHHMTQSHDLNHSPEHMVDLYRRLGQPQQAPSTKTTPAPAPPSTPEPPHHLHIQEVTGDSGVLLAWQPPQLDAQGCSNGCKVLGYMVYLDNKIYEQLTPVTSTELLVDGLDLSRPHRLAVQCLTSGGYASPRAELVFEGAVKLGQSRMETDLSSILNSAHYKRGHRRTVMALYDYSPEQQSPHDYTALELAFNAGDVMYVYGDARQDGFYHGEINDKRGLVPAVFVEDVSENNRAEKPLGQSSS